jgi:hypothetical protein
VYHASGTAEQDDEEDDDEMDDVRLYEEVDYAGEQGVHRLEGGSFENTEEVPNVLHLTERGIMDVDYGGEFNFVDRVWYWSDESFDESSSPALGGILV